MLLACCVLVLCPNRVAALSWQRYTVQHAYGAGRHAHSYVRLHTFCWEGRCREGARVCEQMLGPMPLMVQRVQGESPTSLHPSWLKRSDSPTRPLVVQAALGYYDWLFDRTACDSCAHIPRCISRADACTCTWIRSSQHEYGCTPCCKHDI